MKETKQYSNRAGIEIESKIIGFDKKSAKNLLK